MERLRQTHSKEIENKDDEVEEIRLSCSKKVRGEWENSSLILVFVILTKVGRNILLVSKKLFQTENEKGKITRGKG